MDKQEAFGLFIAKHRDARGLTQAQLASAVGISRPYLAQIENGHRSPSEDKFMALLAALGVKVETFMRECMDDALPPDQYDSLAVLVRGYDALQQNVTPEALAAIMAAQPTVEQLSASLSALGGMPAVPAPDGWVDLSTEDRRLVQRLVNRLLATAPAPREADDEQQEA